MGDAFGTTTESISFKDLLPSRQVLMHRFVTLLVLLFIILLGLLGSWFALRGGESLFARRRRSSEDENETPLSKTQILACLRNYTTDVTESTFRRPSNCAMSDVSSDSGDSGAVGVSGTEKHLLQEKDDNVSVGSDEINAMENVLSRGIVRQASRVALPLPGSRITTPEEEQQKTKKRRRILLPTEILGCLSVNQNAVVESSEEAETPENLSDGMGKNNTAENKESLRNVPNQCAICLGKYDVGDRATWSPNEDCPHAFHETCIVEWLATTEIKKSRNDKRQRNNLTCPCCRHPFIVDTQKTTEDVPIEDVSDEVAQDRASDDH